MSVLVGHPALRRLARTKLRGALRRRVRSLRTPKGALLTLVGLAFLGFWIASIATPFALGPGAGADAASPDLHLKVRAGALLLCALTLTGSLSHRGLYLPAEEIERLFSAPVSRRDLVRYRLWANAGRAVLGASFLAAVVALRMPSPGLAFAGVFLAAQTLALVRQLASLALGVVERRVLERLRVVRLAATFLLVLAIGLASPLLFVPEWRWDDVPLLGQLWRALSEGGGLADSGAFLILTAPLGPSARTIAAQGSAEFLGPFLVCLVLYVLLFELTARIPIDPRELSLQASAKVAARLRRARFGGLAGEASRRAARYRVPWIFGASPAGAVAWRKLASITRKARGTILVSIAVLGFVTVVSHAAGAAAGEADPYAGPLLVAVLGTLYLCAGLRFDFREDLERMEAIKSWPLPPAKLFAAMLLPEVVLVSILVGAAVIARGALQGGVHAAVPAIVCFLPLVTCLWIAVDNAVFLVAPVRHVPGQEGALQNAGRGLLLVFVRFLALGVALAAAFLPAAGAFVLCELLGVPAASVTAAGAVLWLALLAADLGILIVGGLCLRRFDVARDRG